jgi:hypothetical protein
MSGAADKFAMKMSTHCCSNAAGWRACSGRCSSLSPRAGNWLAGQLGLEGTFWDWISGLNANFGALGYGIVALFAVSWIVSLVIYHANGYAQRDERV